MTLSSRHRIRNSSPGGVRTPRAVCVRHLRYVCTYPRSYTIQTLTKTRVWRRSDADCRFRLFCSNRGQRVNPRLSVTVAYQIIQERYRDAVIIRNGKTCVKREYKVCTESKPFFKSRAGESHSETL